MLVNFDWSTCFWAVNSAFLRGMLLGWFGSVAISQEQPKDALNRPGFLFFS